jgi:hypothetical protein
MFEQKKEVKVMDVVVTRSSMEYLVVLSVGSTCCVVTSGDGLTRLVFIADLIVVGSI